MDTKDSLASLPKIVGYGVEIPSENFISMISVSHADDGEGVISDQKVSFSENTYVADGSRWAGWDISELEDSAISPSVHRIYSEPIMELGIRLGIVRK